MRINNNKAVKAYSKGSDQSGLANEENIREFPIIKPGVGFGLFAVIVTTPIWGVFGPIFIPLIFALAILNR